MSEITRFKNRTEAGELLARRLGEYAHRRDTMVLGLPRGGIPVGYAIAKILELPFDVLSVRKLGLPRHEEYAIGAIASGGIRFLQEDIVRAHHVPEQVIDVVVYRELKEMVRRERIYRAGRMPLQLKNMVAIIVDDGLATGATMKVAAMAALKANAAQVIVAVPVAAPNSFDILQPEADEIISLITPDYFGAVGNWYEDFRQVSDDDVMHLLDEAEQDALRRESAWQEAIANKIDASNYLRKE